MMAGSTQLDMDRLNTKMNELYTINMWSLDGDAMV